MVIETELENNETLKETNSISASPLFSSINPSTHFKECFGVLEGIGMIDMRNSEMAQTSLRMKDAASGRFTIIRVRTIRLGSLQSTRCTVYH